jgi:hypothetical protein
MAGIPGKLCLFAIGRSTGAIRELEIKPYALAS